MQTRNENRLYTAHTTTTITPIASIFIFYFKNFTYLLTFIPLRQYWNIFFFLSLCHLSTQKMKREKKKPFESKRVCDCERVKEIETRREKKKRKYLHWNYTPFNVRKLLHFVITPRYFQYIFLSACRFQCISVPSTVEINVFSLSLASGRLFFFLSKNEGKYLLKV